MSGDLVKKLREAMLREGGRFGLAYVILFGSHARGDAGPLSDLDLLVEFLDRRTDLYRLGSLASMVEGEVGRPVDIIQYSSSPPSLRYKAFREGITIYIASKKMYVEDKRRAIMEWLDYSVKYRRLVAIYLEAVLHGRPRADV